MRRFQFGLGHPGQYGPFEPPERLLLLLLQCDRRRASSLLVRQSDFRLWVCLHEVTLSQFTANLAQLGALSRISLLTFEPLTTSDRW